MREEWESTTLGDIATEVRDSVSPDAAPDALYLGLEHLEGGKSQPVGIGKASDTTSNKFRFEAGYVIFGRLRPYLHKMCQPDFGGVCSTEFTVLRPQDAERVLPEFLGVLMQSEQVWSHAVAVSKGTRMPRAAWKDVARLAVAVPPLAEQRRIVDLIDHIDTALATAEVSAQALEQAARHARATAFNSLTGDTASAGEMFDMRLGRQKSARQSVGDHVLPYIRAANIGVDALDISDVQRMNFEPEEQEKYALAPNDVLLVEGGSVGQACFWAGEIPGFVGFDKHVIRVRARPDRSTPSFALHWSHWARETGAFEEQATGLTIQALGYGRASRMPVPRLSVDEQTSLTEPLEALRTTLATQRSHSSVLRRFRREVLTSLLAGDHEVPDSYDRFLEQGAA